MVRCLTLFLGVALLCACSQPKVPEAGSIVNVDPVKPYSFRLTQEESGWGYAIEKEGKVIVDQPHVPGIPGNHPFQSESDASKTAQLVIHKLEAGIFPPAVHRHELDSLGVSLDFE